MDWGGLLFLVRVEERQTARERKKNQNIARFEIPSERRLAMRKRENQNPFPRSNCSKEMSTLNETRKTLAIVSKRGMNAEGDGPLGIGVLVGSRNVLVQDRRPDLSRAG